MTDIKKFAKSCKKQEAELYKNAEIYKLTEDSVKKRIEQLEDMSKRRQLTLNERAKLNVYRHRLEDIETAKSNDLYTEFTLNGQSMAKTPKAISYLSKVEKEKTKSKKFDLFGIRKRRQAKKLEKLKQDQIRHFSNLDEKALIRAHKSLEELRESTEGVLTAEDKVKYEVCHKYYEKAFEEDKNEKSLADFRYARDLENERKTLAKRAQADKERRARKKAAEKEAAALEMGKH